MRWKLPPKIKIYEALGTLGDGRLEISGNSAKVRSSSGNKFYSVAYDPKANAITSNDNSSYWVGYLGYPAIAFLLSKGVIDYKPKFAEALGGIPWKEVNTKFKNDFEKTEGYIKDVLKKKDIDVGRFSEEIEKIYGEIKKLKLNKLGITPKPPAGY
ncbi:MAG: hypothetical protein ABSF47_00815 [Minisyncoccia bacterium]|jgi:hypothetical protein